MVMFPLGTSTEASRRPGPTDRVKSTCTVDGMFSSTLMVARSIAALARFKSVEFFSRSGGKYFNSTSPG